MLLASCDCGDGGGHVRGAGLGDGGAEAPAGFEFVAKQTPANRIEFELDEQLLEFLLVRRAELQAVEVHLERDFTVDCCEPFREQRRVAVLLEILAELALQFGGVGQQILDAAVLDDQFAGGLLADAGHTRDVVRRVAPQADDVDDLLRPLHAPLFADLGQAENFGGIAHASGLVDEGLFGDELAEVLVRRHHVALEVLLLRAPDQCADDVVGLVPVAGQHRNSEAFEQSAHV